MAISSLSPSSRHRRVGAIVGLVLTVGSLAACSNDPASEATEVPDAKISTVADDDIAALVPAEFQGRALTSAMTETFPPAHFRDSSNQLVGVDVDMTNALADVLGVDMTPTSTSFESIVTGVASGKFDLTVDTLNVTPERLQELDFVTYFEAGRSFLLPAGEGDTIAKMDDVCGLNVGTVKGYTSQVDLEEYSPTCVENGLEPIKITTFGDQGTANVALQSGRVDAVAADYVSLAYVESQAPDTFEVTDFQYGEAVQGIGVPKGSPLAEPLQAAVNKLIEDGTYQEILDKWNVADNAIDQSEIMR
jgi:polar amino acid transport system substrate-binding protein